MRFLTATRVKNQRNEDVDQTDVESIRDEYAVLAPVYDARWHRYLKKSTDQTLAVLDPKAGEHVADLGCGTGFLLHRAAENNHDLHLVGIDISREMLCEAWQMVSGRALLAEADARQLPFPDAAFNAVVISSVLQYLPDANQVLSEAARILRPTGRLVVTAWNENALSTRLHACWINWKGRASIYSHPDLQSLIRAAGFRLAHESTYSAGPGWRLRTYLAILGGVQELSRIKGAH